MKWKADLDDIISGKTEDEVFEKTTLNALWKLMSRKVLTTIDFPISTGKEGNVFRATGKTGLVAVKIYRFNTATFRSIAKFLQYDSLTNLKKNRRNIVYAWSQKEFTNLSRLYNAGVSVPAPIDHQGNVVVMGYIGTEEAPAPLLKNASLANPKVVWLTIKENITRMYHNARLVHADLSEYNILYHQKPVIIDVGQTVKVNHPMAEAFLQRDIDNLTQFFSNFFSVSSTKVYNEIVAEDSCDM
jgi:RIO kinase 1